jgi:hypothetical protein
MTPDIFSSPGRRAPRGLGQPLGHAVDDIYLGGTAQHRAVRREQPDGPGPKDGDCVAGPHPRQLGRVISGGEHIRKQEKVVFQIVARAAGELEAIEIGKGDPQVLRLPPRVGPHPRIAVPARHALRVDDQAGVGEAARAVEAGAAADVERHHHAVTHLDAGDSASDLFDDPHVLVAKAHLAALGRASFVHVKVAATDAGRGDSDDRVRRRLQFRIGNILHGDGVRFLVHNRAHRSPPYTIIPSAT